MEIKEQISISVGDYAMVTNGLLHVTKDQNINIKIDDANIIIKFANDDSESRYKGRIVDEKTLEFTLYNHNNIMGQGIYNPIEILSIDDGTLYLTYSVKLVSKEKEVRVFQYVIYTRKSNG